MPLDKRFLEHLKSLGTEERTFIQKEGRKHLDASVSEDVRQEISDGYCHGACLHWLRMSLGNDSSAVSISHEESALVSSMAVTQFKWSQLQREDVLREFSLSKGKEWFDAGAHDTLRDLSLWLETLKCDYAFSIVSPPQRSDIEWHPREKLDPSTYLVIQRRIDEVLASLPEKANASAVAKAKSALPKKLERLRKAPSGKFTTKLWDFMEPRLNGASGERYFEAMLPVVACDGDHSGRISELLCDALAAPSLTHGRGVLITFMCGVHDSSATSEEPRGHAIAVLKVSDQKYRVFDPNLGVYRFDEMRKLIAGLILMLADCYNKRSVAQEDDWVLFARSNQLAPKMLSDGGTVLNKMQVDRDHAVKALRDYLVAQTKEAYEVARQFLEVRTSIEECNARSKKLLAKYDSVEAGTREFSELDAEVDSFQREWSTALERQKQLWSKAMEQCQRIRAFLAGDDEGDGVRLDVEGLTRFVKAEGNISVTGLGELHNYLSGSV